jgi:hypothetical protein
MTRYRDVKAQIAKLRKARDRPLQAGSGWRCCKKDCSLKEEYRLTAEQLGLTGNRFSAATKSATKATKATKT